MSVRLLNHPVYSNSIIIKIVKSEKLVNDMHMIIIISVTIKFERLQYINTCTYTLFIKLF